MWSNAGTIGTAVVYAASGARLSRPAPICRAPDRPDLHAPIRRDHGWHSRAERRVGQRIASRLPAGTEPAVRAYWLSTLGLRLAELARPAEALTAEQEAVAVYRELAAASPDRYRPDLAQSLTNLGEILEAVDRASDADAARDEAAQLHIQPGR
jgi:hypothetical protein